jgi:hypothetical protein
MTDVDTGKAVIDISLPMNTKKLINPVVKK